MLVGSGYLVRVFFSFCRCHSVFAITTATIAATISAIVAAISYSDNCAV